MSNIKLFEAKSVRSHYNEEEDKWYFSIQDIVFILTDSNDVKQYIKKILIRDTILKSNWGTICTPVGMEAADGKKRKIQAANTESVLRIIQSIPSPKAEPFKQWLVSVGAERIAGIENPDLAQQRIRDTYKAKGSSNTQIEKRIRGIVVRDELTSQWNQRGVKEGMESSILTAEISKATFGILPSEYKKLKGIQKANENLRDHMTDLELMFVMLGEASTTEIAKNKNAQVLHNTKRLLSRWQRCRKSEKRFGRKIRQKDCYGNKL